jgi:hypothetical protein
MTPFSERIFLAEIANQIGGARRALRRLRRASREGNTEAVYDDVADLLGHAAIVSKILCPPVNNKRPQITNRGEYLRGVLNVKTSDPVLNRGLRNHLEHIDERLEKWIDKDEFGIYVDKSLLPVSLVAGGKTIRQIRFLDIGTGIYNFLDEQFDLTAIEASLDRIFDAVMRRKRLLDVPSQGRDPFRSQRTRTEEGG